MLLNASWLFVNDNTNVSWLRIFHLYKGFHRNVTTTGFFIKGSARIVEPPRMEYNGFNYNYSLRGNICRSWIIRVNYNKHSRDASVVRFNGNAGIIINNNNIANSKFLLGPITRSIGSKKLLTLFKVVI